MADTHDASAPPVRPSRAGLAGRCPRCGRGALFDGYLSLRGTCPRCGLDYGEADAGDGPAVFTIFITGFVGVALAFILRFAFQAPVLVVLVTAIAATTGLTFALLRPAKGLFVALQYRNRAREGRIE